MDALFTVKPMFGKKFLWSFQSPEMAVLVLLQCRAGSEAVTGCSSLGLRVNGAC